jgi:DNA-binding FadR family transcriptional regulator
MLGQTPKRKVIAGAIRGQLRRGELAPGERLASIRDLGAHFSAGQQAVREALQYLFVNRELAGEAGISEVPADPFGMSGMR